MAQYQTVRSVLRQPRLRHLQGLGVLTGPGAPKLRRDSLPTSLIRHAKGQFALANRYAVPQPASIAVENMAALEGTDGHGPGQRNGEYWLPLTAMA